MEEEKTEETIENPEESETPEEKTEVENQEISNKPEASEDLEEKNKRLYARLKKEEEKRKEIEAQLEKTIKSTTPEGDVEKIAKTIAVFEGLSPEERTRLIQESKVSGKSLEEARKSQEFKDWQVGYRARKEKEKAPEPSTKQETTKVKSLRDMTLDEKSKYFSDRGFVKEFPKPKSL